MESSLDLNDIESWEYITGIEYVYDIEIEDSHNYYLEDEILVHNSGKTYSISQFLMVESEFRQSENLIISIVSESMPHLKRGAMRDFFNILKEENKYNPADHNKTDHTYKIGNVLIEFFSADQEHRLTGSGRDILFVNECNNIKYESMLQLASRTKEKIILDYNPVQEFWVHSKIMPFYDHDYIHSTYLDNIEYLPKSQVLEIETRKNIDPNWWRIYGLGEVGVPQDLIFTFNIVDSFPEDAKKIGFGLDFGHSVDPSALVKCGLYNGEIYAHELIYERGLSPIMNERTGLPSLEQLFEENNITHTDMIFCDPASPLYRDELCSVGYNIKKCDSHKIYDGISLVKMFKLNVTKESVNLIKELRNYVWMKKKSSDNPDALEQKPVPGMDHLIDALRYYAWMMLRQSNTVFPYELVSRAAL